MMIMMKSTTDAANVPNAAASAAVPDLAGSIPRGHVGPYFMSGLGRMIWWTGRVAIGLRYEPLAGHQARGVQHAKP